MDISSRNVGVDEVGAEMSGLCDNCGKEYFVSCHDCMHILTQLYHTVKKCLVLLPATEQYQEVREEHLALKHFYEDKVLANSVKAKE